MNHYKQMNLNPNMVSESINESLKMCKTKRVALNNYIDIHKITMAREIVVPSLRNIKTDKKLFDTPQIKF